MKFTPSSLYGGGGGGDAWLDSYRHAAQHISLGDGK